MINGKSRPYKLNGKIFRYDYGNSVVEYIYKASAEDIKDEQEWIAEHGRPLIGIDADGYSVVETVGLSARNWRDKEVRDECLSGWADDLDEEGAYLAEQFMKYELPMMQKEE